EGNTMNRVGMRDGPDQRDLIHDLRQPGEPVADVQAGYARRDAAQLATDLLGCLGLGVESLELAGRAVQEEEDARLGLAEPGQVGRLPCASCLRLRQALPLRHGQSEQPERPNLE